MLLRRLQPALNNCHPAREILMLRGEQLECTLSLESVFMLGFDIFTECVDPLGYFLMVAVDLLVQFCKASVNLIELLANGIETFLHAAAHVLYLITYAFNFATYILYLALEFVNAIIDASLDSIEVSG